MPPMSDLQRAVELLEKAYEALTNIPIDMLTGDDLDLIEQIADFV